MCGTPFLFPRFLCNNEKLSEQFQILDIIESLEIEDDSQNPIPMVKIKTMSQEFVISMQVQQYFGKLLGLGVFWHNAVNANVVGNFVVGYLNVDVLVQKQPNHLKDEMLTF